MAKPETDNAEALMSAYLDEELDADGKSKLRSDAGRLARDQKELSGLQSMLRLVKALPEEQAPPDFLREGRQEDPPPPLAALAITSVALSLPFQIINVMVILAVAVVYMMLHLQSDGTGGKLGATRRCSRSSSPSRLRLEACSPGHVPTSMPSGTCPSRYCG